MAQVFAVLLLQVCVIWSSSSARIPVRVPATLEHLSSSAKSNGTSACILANCSKQVGLCAVEKACRQALICNSKCASDSNVNACDLLCELNYGYNSTRYREMMQCMVTHHCLPEQKPDGKCLALDSDTVRNLTNMEQMKGKWWILKGINCGQEGWPAGFDYFPCQRDEFVYEGSRWIDHIAYCGGTNNTCTTPVINTVANVSITSPGVMTHWFLDVPLLPQIEHWRVLSWPHPDWMLYIYCGRTPIGLYGGGSVVSNSSRTISDIPSYVEKIFISVAEKFKFNYEEMCVSDNTKCTD